MGKILLAPRCKKCGTRPLNIDDGSGLPSMIGFQMEDGKTINLCRRCIMKLGALKTDEEKDEFFKSIGVNK